MRKERSARQKERAANSSKAMSPPSKYLSLQCTYLGSGERVIAGLLLWLVRWRGTTDDGAMHNDRVTGEVCLVLGERKHPPPSLFFLVGLAGNGRVTVGEMCFGRDAKRHVPPFYCFMHTLRTGAIWLRNVHVMILVANG